MNSSTPTTPNAASTPQLPALLPTLANAFCLNSKTPRFTPAVSAHLTKHYHLDNAHLERSADYLFQPLQEHMDSTGCTLAELQSQTPALSTELLATLLFLLINEGQSGQQVSGPILRPSVDLLLQLLYHLAPRPQPELTAGDDPAYARLLQEHQALLLQLEKRTTPSYRCVAGFLFALLGFFLGISLADSPEPDYNAQPKATPNPPRPRFARTLAPTPPPPKPLILTPQPPRPRLRPPGHPDA